MEVRRRRRRPPAAHLLAAHHAAVGQSPDARVWRASAQVLGFTDQHRRRRPGADTVGIGFYLLQQQI
ncbi:hypothetical protein [Streptomyces sp. TLI_105]|uniref:hypothetical protein n=1 Tax=Streptomyces sp. TLI_105 TaxID=1881019 RepID=UPI00210CC5BF|nr:hypothetical protein [Streptomyces sp. TLI_105]